MPLRSPGGSADRTRNVPSFLSALACSVPLPAGSASPEYRAVSGIPQGPKAPLDARPTRRTPGNAAPPYSYLRDTEVVSDAALTIGRRVIVTGLAGSGKSTFSLALGAKTGLPVIHLDLHFWRPGWVPPSEEEWRDKQRVLLAGDAWIADGNYHETLDLRLERADTVVFLDIPWWVCAGRGFVRGVRERPIDCQLPEGCDESAWRRLRAEWRVAGRTWRERRSQPKREHEIISQYAQHAVLHVLTSKRAVAEFLDRTAVSL